MAMVGAALGAMLWCGAWLACDAFFDRPDEGEDLSYDPPEG